MVATQYPAVQGIRDLSQSLRRIVAQRFTSTALSSTPPRTMPVRIAAHRWEILPGEYATTAQPFVSLLPAWNGIGTGDVLTCAGYTSCVLHLTGQWSGALCLDTSEDGATWEAIPLCSLETGNVTSAVTACGIWRTSPGFAAQFVRVRVAHYCSGILTGSIALTAYPETASGSLSLAA